MAKQISEYNTLKTFCGQNTIFKATLIPGTWNV